MAHSPAVRRKLFMHPAHGTVGVSGDGIAQRPYCRIESDSTDGPAVAPRRIALVAHRQNADACAAVRLFERAIHGRRDVLCRHVDLDALDPESPSLADADCVVVFGRGLHVARHWADFDGAFDRVPTSSPLPLEDGPTFSPLPLGEGQGVRAAATESRQTDGPLQRGEGTKYLVQVEIAAAAPWHPVLDGVQPFVSHQNVPESVRILAGATVLLTARTAGGVQRVAWVEHRHGRVFRTMLGSAADFRQPDFVRLVLNAVAWVMESLPSS